MVYVHIGFIASATSVPFHVSWGQPENKERHIVVTLSVRFNWAYLCRSFSLCRSLWQFGEPLRLDSLEVHLFDHDSYRRYCGDQETVQAY